MKKGESGITVISLIITVIVIGILATIAINTGASTIKSSRLTKFATEMKLMQMKVNELYDYYQNNKTFDLKGVIYVGKGEYDSDGNQITPGIQKIGKDINNLGEENIAVIFSSTESGITDIKGFRYYDQITLERLGLEDMENEYLVNIEKRLIICTEPFQDNGNKYYTLDQLPDGLYNVEYEQQTGIISYEAILEGERENNIRIRIFNISYDKYVNKWQVRYRLKANDGEEENAWKTTESFIGNETSIQVNELGVYEVQVFHEDEIESEIKEVKVEAISELKIGDYIDYVPDKVSQGYSSTNLSFDKTGSNNNLSNIMQDKQYSRDGEGMKWQILRMYPDGSMDLIGTPTSQKIYLQGENGYNNGVTILNDICEKLYSRGDIKARSINYTDVESWLTTAGKNVRDNYRENENAPLYGHTRTYMVENEKYYPNLYLQEKGGKIDSGKVGLTSGIDKESGNTTGLEISEEGTANGYTLAKTSLTVTQTVWVGEMKEDNFGEGYQALKIDSGTCWIASRYVQCYNYGASFGLYIINTTTISGSGIFGSNKIYNSEYNWAFRPVVTLDAGVKIQNCRGENSENNMHIITQY